MRVVIATDLEVISGVVVWEQARDFASPMYQEARRLLMADISAAVEGCLAAGATDIVVEDGHGGGFNFVPELMHPGARYFTGRGRSPFLCWQDMYKGADAGILLGYHAMAGTPDGILRHTQSSRGGNRYWYNGRESGELVQDAILLGYFGIPVVMATGDTACCREAHTFFGPDMVTVEVKQGFGEEYGILLAPAEAHRRITEGAREAVAKAKQLAPYKVDFPIHGRLRFPDKSTADNFHPHATQKVDDYTFEGELKELPDIWFF